MKIYLESFMVSIFQNLLTFISMLVWFITVTQYRNVKLPIFVTILAETDHKMSEVVFILLHWKTITFRVANT